MFNELAPEILVRGPQRQQAVTLRTVGPRSPVKDSARDVRADLSARGLARAKQFSWETTAARTLEVLQEIAS